MPAKVTLAFGRESITLPLEKIFPVRALPADIDKTVKYRRILSSLREVGLIEPLIVYPLKGKGAGYSLLDGTIRLHALRSLGEKDALCLVGTEDETYTYNQKINQVTPIQEHFMILRALKSGVPEERIAKTLNIDASRVREKRNLLNGISPEAVKAIKDKRISAATIREIRRLKPIGQLEMIELMTSTHNFSISYAKCLYLNAPENQKIESERPKGNHGFKPEEMARMNGEIKGLHRDYKVIKDTFGENCLDLVPAIGYLRTLLKNPKIVKFLEQRHRELLEEFQRMVESPQLGAA